ncbi:MAG: pilus assembly protein PilP [Halopseudomonas yangmingensis]|uniref:Type IV pilus assembly protein PilP n=1 Tax=Halopseudomonas yangmingensis TaxID=1720063 RepID=A0A1I4PDX2_9GAMM|nr:pilus assembly protein PilP [Halopseudomonas yangmingensis]SFM25951.1 type IV pilus assembly protein PilP [Halopseudomonas yangmingensis]
MAARNQFAALALTPMLLLTGCGGGDFSDLQAFMEETRARPAGSIEPLPRFKPYESFTYTAADMRNPFQVPVRIDITQRQRGTRDVQPDESRTRQFLEGFNIETFDMVGTLSNAVGMQGLVRGAGSVHRVKIGDYLGRNHGRIIGINENAIEVVEIVPDGEGGWLERPRTLSLSERG